MGNQTQVATKMSNTIHHLPNSHSKAVIPNRGEDETNTGISVIRSILAANCLGVKSGY
jgi:hypothetical protein